MTRRKVRLIYKSIGEFKVCYMQYTRDIRVKRFSKHCLPISHAATLSVFKLNPQKNCNHTLRLVDIHKPHASTVVILVALNQFVGIQVLHNRFNGIVKQGVGGIASWMSVVTFHHALESGPLTNQTYRDTCLVPFQHHKCMELKHRPGRAIVPYSTC